MKKEARDKVRREAGTVAVSETPNGPVAMDKKALKARQAGLKMFSEAKKAGA